MSNKLTIAKDKRKHQSKDDKGVVIIKMFLQQKGHSPVKGNIIKTISLENVKVSEVYEQIMKLVRGV